MNAETPDFDQIARTSVARWGSLTWTATIDDIAEQLRLIWNARGAADIAKLDATLPLICAPQPLDGWLAEHLDRALRTLDR